MCVCMCVCNRDGKGGGGEEAWPHTSGTVILAPSAGLFFSTLYFQITHMHTHMHCSATGQGWVGLGRGTVVECLSSHAPQTSLWPALPLLALSAFAPVSGHCFFRRSPHCCKGHERKCCGEGIEPHSGDEVWACLVLLSPDGRVQNGDCRTSWYNEGVGGSNSTWNPVAVYLKIALGCAKGSRCWDNLTCTVNLLNLCHAKILLGLCTCVLAIKLR